MDQAPPPDFPLRHDPALLDSILGSLEDVVWSASAADAQALYLSPGAQKVFGRAPSDLDTAAKWLDAIHPDDREQVERWRQARWDTDRVTLEYRIVRPDGEVRWVRDRCYTARDASGAAVRYDGILTDITEHKRMEEALRQSETRLSEIAENMTDLIIETDLNAVVLYASPSFKTVLGYDPQTLIGRSTFDLGIIHPDDAARAAQIGAEQAQLALTGANEAWRLEQRLRHSDGHYLCVEHATRFLRDERGQIVGVLTVARDMTDRRRTEKALRQRAEELTALYETSLEVSAQTDLNALLQAIVERAARLVGARMGGLYLIQPDGQTLKLVVSHYLPGDYTGTELRLGEGLSGRVAQTGEPMLIEDYRLWDDRARAFDDVPFRRVLGVPLKVRHEVIGVINVTDDERGGPFSEDEVRLVQLFADQAAVAIENAQLFEATRRQLEELTILHAAASAGMEATSEDDLIARAMQIISAIFYPGNLSVLLLDEATSVLHPHRSSRGLSKEGPPRTRQLGEGVIGQVAQFGRSQRLVDIRLTPEALPLGAKTCAVLCVPLKIGDRAVGVINVESPEPDAFDEADEQLLTTLAEQLAIGLSRQRSEAAEREARALAEALQRTASALNSTLDFDEVLDRVLAQLGHIVPHDAAGFMLLEPESGLVRVARGHGYPDAESIMQSRFPVAEAPDLRQMIEVGQPLVVPDTRVVPGWVRSSIAQWARSYTAAPVRVKGQVIGFLHVASRTPGAFTWAHADRLQVFADQTAIAIQNAQLFEAAQRQLVQQRALLTASQAISSSLDLATVLSRVAEQIGRAIDVTSVYIRDWDMETDNSRVLAEYYGPDASPAERVSDLGVIYNVQRDFGEEAARLVRAGRVIAYHVDDPGAPELMRRYLQQYGGQTELDIPLIVRNTVIGYAELWDSRRQRDFTPDEIALAQGIAQQAAVAIENARLFGETRNRAERLALINEISATVNSQLDLNAILQATADSLARALSISEVGLALLDDDSRRLIVMADHTAPGLASMAGVELRVEDGSSLERILAAKRPLAIMDAQTDPLLADLRDLAAERRAQSLLIVPLLVRGEAIGFIVCHEIDAPRQFSAEEIELAETIANLVAARIEQAHLLDAERQRRREIEAIQQASLSLTASLELPQVLTVILSTVSTLVPLEDTHIFFYDGERLTFAAAVTPRGRLDRAVIEPRPGGFTHTVARTGQSMIIEDVSQHPLPIGAPPDRAGAVIGLPLTIDSTVVGVMNVYFPTTRRIPESERRVLSLLAAHAAIAIQNAQLYEAVRRSKDELEQRVIERTAELEAERQRLQTILDAAGEGIYITDAEREIRYVNPALGRITGYEPDELIGQSPRIWRSGYTEASVLDELTHSMKRGLAWRGELVNRRKDGTLYDVALTVSPLRDASGRLIGFVCIQRDITRLKELERLKDQFVSRIGHELRTPVANIKLYLELLERGRPEKHGQYLLTLLHETERLRNLVEGFLEISQFDTGAIQVRLSPVDVNQLARELIGTQRAVAVERGLELSAELAPDMPPARADRALIAQALSRLLDNALKYTAVGGRVAVVTTVQRQADLDWVTVAVRDTGPGISADEIPHLFERFYRGEVTRDFATPGTGLGLAICKEIVDRLGGRITVDSQPNQGATFTVWLKPVSG